MAEKKMRVDKRKNVEKVAKAMIENPRATEREIAKKVWIGKSSVNRLKEELGQIGAKDERILTLTDWDREQQLTIQKIKNERLQEPDKISNKDLNSREEFAMKRYSLFRGNATDNNWWLNAKVVGLPDLIE